MDPIDPMKAMPLQGLPMTDEIAMTVKAKVRQAKMETSEDARESSDVSDLSPEGLRLSKPQFEAFLEVAKEQLAQMDPHSETYLSDATNTLVSNAFERKFGEKFLHDPGFPNMQARVANFILNDPESRSMIENMLELIHMENSQTA